MLKAIPRRTVLWALAITVLGCLAALCVSWAHREIDRSEGATAPSVESIPRPPDWSRSDRDDVTCFGSGGQFCNRALLDPPTRMSSDEAVTQYRAFLRSQGWIETGLDLLHDTSASSVSLTVEARDPFARKTDQPLGAGEILVTASFADDGAHAQTAAARRTRTVLLVLAPVPGALILVAARRRNTS
jgi:hypothetical protein